MVTITGSVQNSDATASCHCESPLIKTMQESVFNRSCVELVFFALSLSVTACEIDTDVVPATVPGTAPNVGERPGLDRQDEEEEDDATRASTLAVALFWSTG